MGHTNLCIQEVQLTPIRINMIQTKTHNSHIVKTKYMMLHCNNYSFGNFLVFELGGGFTV